MISVSPGRVPDSRPFKESRVLVQSSLFGTHEVYAISKFAVSYLHSWKYKVYDIVA
jgi:hypothetical protein